MQIKEYNEPHFIRVSYDSCINAYNTFGAKKMLDNDLYWLARYSSLLEKDRFSYGLSFEEYTSKYLDLNIVDECLNEGIDREIITFKYLKFCILTSLFSNEETISEARKLLLELVYEDGYAPACLAYAHALIYGEIGVERDVNEAYKLMKACADFGIEYAQKSLKYFKKGLFSKNWRFVE